MKYLLCVLGLFVVTSTAAAEEVTRKAGDRSINFSLFRAELQEYKFGFGGKYWTSSNMALSASIDVSKNESKNNDTAMGGWTSKSDSKYNALSLALERHLQTSSNLSPYIGAEVKYSRYVSEYNQHDSTNYLYFSNSVENMYGAGIVAGAEYALNRSVSLAGEYSYGYAFRKYKHTNTFNTVYTSRSNGFNLGVGRLTLLLYF